MVMGVVIIVAVVVTVVVVVVVGLLIVTSGSCAGIMCTLRAGDFLDSR